MFAGAGQGLPQSADVHSQDQGAEEHKQPVETFRRNTKTSSGSHSK